MYNSFSSDEINERTLYIKIWFLHVTENVCQGWSIGTILGSKVPAVF